VARATAQLDGNEKLPIEGLRASYGVASCPSDAPEAQTLFRLADEALYLAKRNGSGLQFVA
jgi:GGDEF domain-containing protein